MSTLDPKALDKLSENTQQLKILVEKLLRIYK
jgi:hypothetical protein